MILGDDEAARNVAKIKNLKTGEEKEVPFGDILSALK